MHTPKILIWIHGVEQPDLFETIKKTWFPRQCEFVAGFPEDLLTHLEQTSDRGSLCIFDDVMNEFQLNGIQIIYVWKKPLRLFLGINVAKHIPKMQTE